MRVKTPKPCRKTGMPTSSPQSNIFEDDKGNKIIAELLVIDGGHRLFHPRPPP